MLENHLQKYFGFNTFLNGQEAVIRKVMDGRSAAAIFPTGAGKSLCYQLPAVLLPGISLVVSPLLSLMKDQLDFLQSHRIPAARLDSTLPKDVYNAVLAKACSGVLKILMISVERFKNERFRSQLEKMRVSLLVVDEAHCISEWGHNFRPEYLKLPLYQRQFAVQQTLLLTATATEPVIEDMCAKFDISKKDIVVTGFYRKNLRLAVTPASDGSKNQRLLERISREPQTPTIVYVTLQKTAESVAQFLDSKGIKAHPYHAGMSAEKRESVQNRFMRGSLPCVVATIAFGMGIDKKDIRRIIHYDLPKSIENYSQEIGRAGRDGQTALCEVFACRDNIPVLENFIYGDTPEKSAIHDLLASIKANKGRIWEVKIIRLSSEFNIRLLPLKTLLVYLSMADVIRPKLSYFEEYAFKYRTKTTDIIAGFKGERKRFVKTLLDHCQTRKIWTSVDIPSIVKTYPAERQRIVSALEYFDQQGWIELQARQAVEVYDLLTQDFDVGELAENLFVQFKKKERLEIQRIHTMVRFFESPTCLSKRLAAYFGEQLEKEHCGHCSVCTEGPVAIQKTMSLPPLDQFDRAVYKTEFEKIAGDDANPLNLAKFLCGIQTPAFARRKAKQQPNFGRLAQYPFKEVSAWLKKDQP